MLNKLKALYWSEPSKHYRGMPRRLYTHWQQRRNHPIFSVDFHPHAGLFGIMQTVLLILRHCEVKGLYPDVRIYGGSYGDAEGKIDWFAEMFQRVRQYPAEIESRLAADETIRSRINGLAELGIHRLYDRDLTIEHASALFVSHFQPSPAITAECDRLCRELDLGPATLAVHYRGSDKVFEAERVEWTTVVDHVRRTIATAPGIQNIFVNSDQADFIEHFKTLKLGRPVVTLPTKHFAVGSRPVHFTGASGFEIGREALLTCLTIARCGRLIKTASYLSAWACVLNPGLRAHLLSPPLKTAFWFPDSALWQKQQNSEPSNSRQVLLP